ncbi:DUF3450 domain-containing protein [Woodsholea maritima]|uniref:DUF3450 domain-containing protein n=1 Tax=Woodsholea maritima TaxID=240237 RepID=UPI00036C5313|nr:DUF3450 domain-containing protein [Woodsholea maritima]
MSNKVKRIRTAVAGAALALVAAGAAHAQLDQALQTAQRSTQEGAQAQAQIDRLGDEAQDLEREYLALREQIESQRVFVEQQEVFLRSQNNEVGSLQAQLQRVSTIERDLTPMLLEMYVSLEAFIAADLPYKIQQRQDRLANIQDMLGEASITPAEKYRVLLNAFEIEAAAGRSLSTYSEEVVRDGVAEEAEILQIGRVAMIRRFNDGVTEIMTKDNQSWRPVPGSAGGDLDRAYRIASEITTPDVFAAPLPAPVSQ